MEHVFFKFHERQSNFFLRNFSRQTRLALENTALIIAITSVFVVAVSHRTFVYRGKGIQSAGKFYIPGLCLGSVQGWDDDVDITHIVVSNEYQNEMEESSLGNESYIWKSNKAYDETSPYIENEDKLSCRRDKKKEPNDEDILLSYSQTEGFLLLPKEVQIEHNITSQYFVVSKYDANCFGEPIHQNLVFYVTGPNTVIVNWFLALHNGDGYIYNPKTQKITDLHTYATVINSIRHSSSEPRHKIFLYKSSVLLTSLFLFFMTTTLTSFILHETQNRMLNFTVSLQARVRNRIPFTKLICRHVVESLVFVPIMVGVLVFLIEFVFFGNAILGFGVISLVWCGEVFSVICMRTRASMYFFPRIFFIYFTLFHVYFFSCPFGFSLTSLHATFLLTVHAMAFFLNRYEFPALQRGIISARIPRMFAIGGELTPTANMELRNAQTIQQDTQTRSRYIRNQYSSTSSNDVGSVGSVNLTFRSRERQLGSYPNMNSNLSYHSLSNMSAPSTVRPEGSVVGSARSSSPSGIQSYPSATLFYADGEGEDDDSYDIFMNGEIVRHTDRNSRNIELRGGDHIGVGETINNSFARNNNSSSRREFSQTEISSTSNSMAASMTRQTTTSSHSMRNLTHRVDSNADLGSVRRSVSVSPFVSSDYLWNFDISNNNRESE